MYWISVFHWFCRRKFREAVYVPNLRYPSEKTENKILFSVFADGYREWQNENRDFRSVIRGE